MTRTVNIQVAALSVFLLTAAVALSSSHGAEADDTSVLSAIKDSFIRKRGYDANEGANPILQVKYAVRLLVAFDQSAITSILEGKTLLSAKLSLYIVKNGNNWGENGHMISLHKLLENWEEGNGWNVGNTIQGSGSGVTWRCAVDNDISNNESDCETRWRGGNLAPETDSALIMNGMVDQRMEFDVTNDVNEFLSGTPDYGWLIKKIDERQPGRVDFASSESANGPELILAFTSAEVIMPPVTNVPPTSNDDTATTDEDTSVFVDVLANDLDPDNDIISVTSVSLPLHGLAAIIDNGIIYTPDDSLDSLAADEIVTDAFTYTISDSFGAVSTGTVSVTIVGLDDAPPPDTTPTPPDSTPTYDLRVSSFASFDGFLVYESSVLGSYNVSIDHGNGVFYVESMHGSIGVNLSHTTSGGTTSQTFVLSEGEYRGINVSSGDSVLIALTSNSPALFAFVFDPAS